MNLLHLVLVKLIEEPVEGVVVLVGWLLLRQWRWWWWWRRRRSTASAAA
jgi:hypothetical protein